MTRKPKTRPSLETRYFGAHRGFALVATLSLMMLPVLQAVGLLSLSTWQTGV